MALVSAAAELPVANAGALIQACLSLRKTSPNTTYVPSDQGYAALSTENWSATARATPACIAQPATAGELQSIVKLLTSKDVKFAVRSGGHSPSPAPFGANIIDGVLIDLSSLSQVVYDAASGTATVGAGNRWGAVYDALTPHNVTVVGGRVVDVGAGGLILGGGLSYLSDLYGMVCDNVAEFEVVLGNGSLIKANQNQNADLHWALKGGSSNFGIVTAFKLYTYPMGLVWGGRKFYTFDKLPQLFNAMLEYQSMPNKDLYANVDLQGFTTNTTQWFILTLVYLKPEAHPPAMAPFYDIPTAMDTTQIQTYPEFLAGQPAPDIPRWDWFTTTFTPTAALYSQITSIVTTAPELAAISSLTAGSLAIGVQPISANLVLAGQLRGGNPLGLQPVNQTWLVLDTGWWSPAGDAVAHNATAGLITRIERASTKSGQYLPYIFQNDASYDQAVLQHYGEANVARLKKVQRRYDPGLVFQRLVPGGWKLL
ncbi:putative FAD-binding oxidoreductase [Bombardia bombarda]|uniref:FAD-binding oxidoreductase n=1 Tax=Bombardia bombarda TaxID=252184 RepID=A0AA40CGL6_9PEZI|nr:putative FAD-binding oxidoreductase [Bombardia bombarda]